MPELIDTHIHLDFEQYSGIEKELLARASEKGVNKIITIGAGGVESAKRAIQLTERFPNIWASVGVHPHDADKETSIEELKALSLHPKVVAIGETGLDFFKNWSDIENQRKWFRKQITLAKEVKKPLIIHSRDAGEESLKTLIEFGAKEVRGVFHCYSEDASFAERLREINFLVSFTGNITFKKAQPLRDIIANIPLTQIMVETDGPYMAPEPFRGAICESMHVFEIAHTIAKVKGVPFEEVCQQTTKNAIDLFGFNSL